MVMMEQVVLVENQERLVQQELQVQQVHQDQQDKVVQEKLQVHQVHQVQVVQQVKVEQMDQQDLVV